MEIGGHFPLRPPMRARPPARCFPEIRRPGSLVLPGLTGFRRSRRSFSASVSAQVSFRVRKNAQDGLGGAHLGAVAQVGADVAGGADVAVTEPDLDVLQGHAVGVQLAEEDFLRYAYAAVLASECSGLAENVLRAR